MRRVWASTLGISLSLGAANAWAQDGSWGMEKSEAVTLGRPVPAATLGRPLPLTSGTIMGGAPIQPATFQNNKPAVPQPDPVMRDDAPLLAPITTQAQGPAGGAGSSAKPKVTSDGTPAPLPAPTPAPAAPSATAPAAVPYTFYDTAWDYGPANSLFGPIFPYAGGPNRFYANVEYLLWWVKGANVPALAISTPTVPTNTNPVPQPATVLFGGGTNLYPTNRYGGRFNLGMWFSPTQCRGIDASFFFLGASSTNYVVTSAQVPNISRPFFNVNRAEPFTEIVAGTGISTGNLSIAGTSSFLGADINYRRALFARCDGCGRIDGLLGFRYLNLSESLQITENFATVPNPIGGVPTASGTVIDNFNTSNNFYGAQLGLFYSRQLGRWSVDASAKVALGGTYSQVNINGSQNLVINGVPTTANGGLLALSTNSGTYNSSAFAVVPEIGINLGYQITPRMKFFVGYSFLYWSNVMRPGDQIDTNIDVTHIPNFNPVDRNGNPITTTVSNQPMALLKHTDFWAQGINFGLQFKW